MKIEMTRLDRTLARGQYRGPDAVRAVSAEDAAPVKESMVNRYQKAWGARTPRLNWALLRRELNSAVGTDYDQFVRSLLARFSPALKIKVWDWLSLHVAVRGSPDEPHAFWVVDPVTRMLGRQEAPTARVVVIAPSQPNRLNVGDDYLLKEAGVWYYVTTAPVNRLWDKPAFPYYSIPRDVVTGKPAILGLYRYGTPEGETRYNATKRQLSHKELRFYGVAND